MAPPKKRRPGVSGLSSQALPASLLPGIAGKQVREPESIDAPPLSSGDERSGQEVMEPRNGSLRNTSAQKQPSKSKKLQTRMDFSSDDEAPRSRKADMGETAFRKAGANADTLVADSPRRRSTRQQATLGRKAENRPPKRSRGSDSSSLSDPSDVSEPELNDPASHFAKRAKMSNLGNKPPLARPSNLADPFSPFHTRTKAINTYGKKPSQGPRHSARTDSPKFKAFHQDASPEKWLPKNTFVNPSDPQSSPDGDPTKASSTFKTVKSRIETPSKRPRFRNPEAALDKSDSQEEESHRGKPRNSQAKTWSKPHTSLKLKLRTIGSNLEPEPASPKIEPASFKNPINMDDGSALSSPENSAPEDEESELSTPPPASDEPTPTPTPTPVPAATCPMCGKEVDPGLLTQFSGGKRMPIRTQARFCREHQKTTALSEWSTKKYPDIDWTKLDSRLGGQRALLVDIVEKRRASPFAKQLEENIRNGTARTLLKTENGLAVPGYYGPRGFTKISEILTRQLGSLLREKAVSEKVISARGTTTFVQTVLVPEAAVRLIMEDMSVDEDDARRIMAQSVKIGELLNEDTIQVVRDKPREDDDAADSELSELSDIWDQDQA